MKTYTVKEIFYSLQGEGVWSGTPANFVRFAGCNMWSGRPEDKAASVCWFCDTDFVGGEKMTARAIILSLNPRAEMVVFTGGEPGLQLDAELVNDVRAHGYRVHVETNGTLPLPNVDWITLSPKGPKVVLEYADEVKLLFPQSPSVLGQWEAFPAERHSLQPITPDPDGENLAAAVEECLARGQWSISEQSHKRWSVR